MSFWCCFAGLGLVGAGSEIAFCLDERDSMMIYKNWGIGGATTSTLVKMS